jgi:hypothetical protein
MNSRRFIVDLLLRRRPAAYRFDPAASPHQVHQAHAKGMCIASALNLSNALSKLQAIFAWEQGKQRIAQRVRI